jgi:hypothetical protein
LALAFGVAVGVVGRGMVSRRWRFFGPIKFDRCLGLAP